MLSNKLKCLGGILLRLLIAVAAWYAFTLASVYGISALLLRLLSSWGVTYANLPQCPIWIQYLVTYQTGIYSAVAAMITIAVSALLLRNIKSKPGALRTAAGFAAGIAVSALFAAIFLATDSMRPYTFSAGFSAHTFISLAMLTLTSLAEAALAFGYIRLSAEKRGGKAAGYLCAVIMFCIMNTFSTAGAMGTVNLVFIALLMCLISEKSGILPAAALRTGFLWCSTAVIGFTGAETAVFRLYPVSETLLTGGQRGLMHGLAFTIICAIPPLILLIRHIKSSRK